MSSQTSQNLFSNFWLFASTLIVGQPPSAGFVMADSSVKYQLVSYSGKFQHDWDSLVASARNSHFLFFREFLEYHADRFKDASLLLFRQDKAIALLPAHIENNELHSHSGLTFGGWIVAPDCRYEDLEAGFELLEQEMRRQNLYRLLYRPVPFPYQSEPCGDDQYLLQQRGARCESVLLGAFMTTSTDRLSKKQLRKNLRKAEEQFPCQFQETDDLDRFWQLLSRFLHERHGSTPVHSLAEIKLLKSRFPENIRCVVAHHGDEWYGGEVIFLSRQVTRFQYGFRTLEQPLSNIHLRLFEWIRRQPDYTRPWIDLGTSMDPASGQLQKSLHRHKENLGCRGIPLLTLVWDL
ncbi:MAG: hypothetical protein DRH08_04470 [Deltaproteobacteria bacterium]|nr:MAG: hypothetical protein DRH08_04470 [Deltaproteobacteria bacterium]